MGIKTIIKNILKSVRKLITYFGGGNIVGIGYRSFCQIRRVVYPMG